MKIFKINDKIEIVCQAKNTRNGFKHEATLFINGSESNTAKCCYLNQTWEAYPFQSVLHCVVDKSDLDENERAECHNFINMPKAFY